MFPGCRKGIKMWVMLPVILWNPGIVRDFIRLSDKALKQLLAAENPGCKLVFSNSLELWLYFLFQLTFSCLFVTVCTVHALFLVWTRQHHLWHFHIVSLCCVCSHNKETPLVLPACSKTNLSLSWKSQYHLYQITHIKCAMLRHFDDDLPSLLQAFWETWSSSLLHLAQVSGSQIC